MASEAFPLSHRETGGAFSIFCNNTLSTALGLTFPMMLEAMGGECVFNFAGMRDLLI